MAYLNRKGIYSKKKKEEEGIGHIKQYTDRENCERF